MASSGTFTKDGPQIIPEPLPDLGAGTKGKALIPHPAGRVKYGALVQFIRMLLFTTWFTVVSISIQATQWLGSWLYFVNKDYYYAYMSLTKQFYGLFITSITEWFSPTLIRVSGDKSMRGQLFKTKDGRLRTDFNERLIMIANHQIYTDWLYLWWIAYANKMHGHIYIILKESLKWIPILGWGMQFYSFIFMARKWNHDKPRIQHRLGKLKAQHSGPMSGSHSLDPMWLLIFPEGTNLSPNTRKKSQSWAEKQGLADMKHQLLPRSTGLQFCLQELHGTVDWIYDCTIAYEGTPQGGFAQDYFTLRSTYFQGRPPKSVNMYWRRFAIADIPVDDHDAFDLWLRERWVEKDALLEHYVQNGRFPADEGHDSDGKALGSKSKVIKGAGYIETEVKLSHWSETGQIFVVLGALALLINIGTKVYNFLI
ncbi:MAG: hypothetical protein M1834_000195 [Cirrosporium novae-zelandiae]|nr:MAG: hypothetical protein M1834_000195 [Cirrosporium novae-zelandiae]